MERYSLLRSTVRSLVLIAYLMIFVIAVHAGIPSIPSPNFTGQTQYEIVRVIDGDTLVVSIQDKPVTIRLIGIDTPETVHPQKPVETYGKEASNFLTNLLKGEKVYLLADESGNAADAYNRQLRYVYRAPDGLFVNAEIIRQGYGHAYTMFPFKYLEQFRQIEGFATTTASPTVPAPARAPKIETQETKSTIVYITKTGAKYHRAGCRYLSKSSIPIELKDAISRGYTPCSVCRPTSAVIDLSSPRAPPENSQLVTNTPDNSQPKKSVAENGSYYGETSQQTGKPKTVYVNGYYRKDGTYVRGHYRSK